MTELPTRLYKRRVDVLALAPMTHFNNVERHILEQFEARQEVDSMYKLRWDKNMCEPWTYVVLVHVGEQGSNGVT